MLSALLWLVKYSCHSIWPGSDYRHYPVYTFLSPSTEWAPEIIGRIILTHYIRINIIADI